MEVLWYMIQKIIGKEGKFLHLYENESEKSKKEFDELKIEETISNNKPLKSKKVMHKV